MMHRRLRRGSLAAAPGTVAAEILLTLGTVAAWGEDSRQSASVHFTTKRIAASSGLEVRIDYVNPADPEGQPPAVREIVLELARGARVDTAAPVQCTASDPELMLFGASTCEEGSQVGGGFARIDTGLPGPLRFLDTDLTLLNERRGLIFLFTERGTGVRVASHATLEGRRRFVNQVAPLPGAPPDGGSVDVVEESIDAVSRGERNYITTPARCPKRRFWRNRISFTYADGVSQTVRTRAPCKRKRGRPSARAR